MLSLSHISFSYGLVQILDDVSIEVPKAKVVCIMGRNGVGKTTLMRNIVGLEKASKGSVTLDGRDISKVPARQRAQSGLALVPQGRMIFPRLTVKENLEVGLSARTDGRRTIPEEIYELFPVLKEMGARQGGNLSGGQQQRVALARALVFEPNLLLMDEPLGALDKKLREQMQIEIKHLHEALGTTVVYVTHDQAEALTMSDRVAVMDEGCIQQTGTPQEIYERPDSSFVANFIGENNNLDGTVERIDGDDCEVRLVSGDIVVASRVGVSQVGDRTTVSVRPEQLEINPNGEAHPNRFQSEVVEEINFSDHNSMSLAVAGRDEIIEKQTHKHI